MTEKATVKVLSYVQRLVTTHARATGTQCSILLSCHHWFDHSDGTLPSIGDVVECPHCQPVRHLEPV